MIDWIAIFGAPTPSIPDNYEKKLSVNGLMVYEVGGCRFPDDHLCVASDQHAIVIDGLILNQDELFEKYHTHDFHDLVVTLQREHPDDFFNDFRGPFTGLYYDSELQQATVFTNQTGDSSVFYYLDESFSIFSSNFTLLSEFLEYNCIKKNFCKKAAHWMLTFGYLIDEAMFVEEVKRIQPGKAMKLKDGRWELYRYHRFPSQTIEVGEEEAVEEIDRLFRQAVKRCFDKDLHYGYTQHLVDMSAGMDSRMVNVVASLMGYGPITNISYSQTGSEEEVLSKAMSQKLGNEMIFEPLDEHQFLYDAERLTKGHFGTYLYSGITGGERLLSKIDFNKFGAEQTGQLGDIAIGTFVKTDSIAVDPETVRLSHLLSLAYNPNPENIANQDLYSLYTRGFQGAMSSWFIRKHYTFALSPFTDVDFMSYCYSLPIDLRRNHNLYWKWVGRYYPEALEVATSRKHLPVTTLQKVCDLGERAFHKAMKVGRKVLFKVGMVKSRISPTSSMNPYDYWYDTDPKVREYFDGALTRMDDADVDALKGLGLWDDIVTMHSSSSMLDKLMSLTVTTAYQLFIHNKPLKR